MSLHIILLSGMDAKDTTAYLIENGFNNDVVLENQIQRYTKTIGTNNPVIVTLWVALNTVLTQHLMMGIKYRIKNILYVYNSMKPITLIRSHGWYKFIQETFDCSAFNMILCATIATKAVPNVGYERMISHIANKFLSKNDTTMPHYASTLTKIFNHF